MNMKSDSSSRMLAFSLVAVLLGVVFPCGAYAIGENSSQDAQHASADAGLVNVGVDSAMQEAVPQDNALAIQPEADPADFEYDIESGDYGYGAYITRYMGTDTHVVIPAQLGGADVVSAEIGGSGLASVDASAATSLVSLHCSSNKITSLDVSKNLALTMLDCADNPLTYLDVSNNPALEVLFCNMTYLASLDVRGDAALTELHCASCRLTSLDVSDTPALSTLDCSKNALASLDVAKCPLLDTLYCSENSLGSLDVSKNSILTDLMCYSDGLSSLDVSHNPQLGVLFCYTNSIASLDVSNNTSLRRLKCSNNRLTSLDISANTHLSILSCDNNCIGDTSLLTAWLQVQGHSGSVSPQKSNIASATIGLVSDQTYTGKAFTPEPTVNLAGNNLVKDTDYALTYSNNIAAGTATITVSGLGTYGGMATTTFTINPADISSGTIVPIPDQSYTGNPISPIVNVALKNADLTEGADYEVAYKDNTAAGVATVVVSGKGNYTGSIIAVFNIVGGAQDGSGSNADVVPAASQPTPPASPAPVSTIPATGDFWFLLIAICAAALVAGVVCLAVFLKRKRYR